MLLVRTHDDLHVARVLNLISDPALYIVIHKYGGRIGRPFVIFLLIICKSNPPARLSPGVAHLSIRHTRVMELEKELNQLSEHLSSTLRRGANQRGQCGRMQILAL